MSFCEDSIIKKKGIELIYIVKLLMRVLYYVYINCNDINPFPF